MHRTSPRAWALLGALVAVLAGGLAHEAHGQMCSPEQRPLVVLINSTVRLQMSTKKNIRSVTNPKEGVLSIRTIERDPTSIILIGTQAGVTRLEFEDADGFKETREVLVQADVEYLKIQLRCAVPQAQICVTPNGASSVILTGYVQRAEDISVLLAVAQSVGFQVINGLRLNGVQQVQLDVVIAQVRRTKGRNFGFNFLQNSRRQILGSTVGNLIPIATIPVGAPSGALQPTGLGQIINAAPGTTNIFGGVISTNAGFLGFLQALETEGLAKILSQPRLVTLSGQPASFLAGGEQAVPVPAGLGQVGVQFEEFGTRLNFVPIVLGNGRIHLEVEPEVSTLDPNAGVAIAGATVAGRATQRIHTTVELETGQTFVIGGLIQKVTTGNANKVPFLGQLPFIGAAFSTKTHTDDETELVVMVTPHLVDAQSADQVVKVLPGQETRTPDDFELFLEGILEAPRGPRAVFVNGRYIPAHRNGPTADLFPCAGSGNCKTPHSLLSGHGGAGASCGPNGCGSAPMDIPAGFESGGNAPMARTPQQLPIQNPVAPAGLKSEPVSSEEPPLTQTGGVTPGNELPEGSKRMELPPLPANLPTRLPEEQPGQGETESTQVPPVRTMGGETP